MDIKVQDQEEKDLINETEAHAQPGIPEDMAMRQRLQSAAKRALKTERINIRLSKEDLEGIKHKAQEQGLPYQTLISSIIHQYVAR
ncbi:CopG family antitoxin [Candidatus Haliotispira prima]|uniref:CopG family antitoxin n=1 Tax=Candidatus Haliotispira prima TaxID=3034016 RepID=A0ABY8MFE8_9SPIO|nr:CopG family antitoxin [Candidatus Haliotispira prima]